MTKTSSAVAQACSKVEISADGVTWTDIGSEATTVTLPKEVVTTGSVPVFGDDYHVTTSGKIAPITVTVSGVYTETVAEAFETVLAVWAVEGCTKRLDLRVTPRGGGVGQREITISPGVLVGLKPPDLSAADGGPALFEFDVYGNYGNVATYTVTTTGAQTHTIQSLGVSAPTVVDWGDGSRDTYSGTALRTHNYAGAGTWLVTIYTPKNVVTFDIRDNKVNLNSADIASMVNVTHVTLTTLRSGRFDSADVSDWRPVTFSLHTMPAGYAGTFNSADVSAWRPTTFYLHTMPAGYAGTFNSADVSDWRPVGFSLCSMPAGYAGTFDSADVSDWRPVTFYLHTMPAGYAGTFDSADVSDWRPTIFHMYAMPAGYAITSGGGWANWNTTTDFCVHGNGLLTATVDAILWELYQATLARTVTGGTINVGGTNQAPSGVFQAASACPVSAATPGKEIAHELLNDSCDAIAAGETWATVTITA